jgi:hypothetical protein
MKNWNKTGKIKTILLAIFSLPNLIVPIGAFPQQGLFASILMPLIFGSIAVPLICKANQTFRNIEIVKPNWNNNPFKFKKPLTFFQFGAFFFLTLGFSMLVGTAIKYQLFNTFGLSLISFGIGLLIGIKVTLKRISKADQKGANNI